MAALAETEVTQFTPELVPGSELDVSIAEVVVICHMWHCSVDPAGWC